MQASLRSSPRGLARPSDGKGLLNPCLPPGCLLPIPCRSYSPGVLGCLCCSLITLRISFIFSLFLSLWLRFRTTALPFNSVMNLFLLSMYILLKFYFSYF